LTHDLVRRSGRAARRASARGSIVAALVAASLLLACASDTPDGPGDVFIVVIDTLRRDVLRTFEPDMPLGEHFDALARDAIVFDDLRSGTSWTRPAVASLLTGQHADRHGIHGRRDVLPPSGPHVVEALRAAGYATHAWSANPNILPLWGFERGFDSFVDLGENLPKEPGRQREPKVDGAMAFDRVLEAVEASTGPGLYYVHVVDPHRPYRPPAEVLAELDGMGDLVERTFPVEVGAPFTRIVRDTYWRRYVGEVLDVDRALGAFVAHLKALGRYERATILVVSDHGEEFLEHGGEVHGFTLFEEVLRVPGLLKRAGGVGAGTRVTAPAEIADMMPTLLASLGLEIPADVDGHNLLEAEPAGEAPRFADLFLDRVRLAAMYEGSHKLIVDYLSGRTELYELASDPEERRDLARKEPERVARMRAVLEQARARHGAGWHLRGCGCRDRIEELRFALSWEGGVAASLDVEPEDEVEIAAGEARVRWVLEPDRDRAASAETRRADRDELVLRGIDGEGATTGATHVRVSPRGDAPLAVAFGRGEVAPHEGEVDLDAMRGPATLDASAPVDCLALVRAFSDKDPGAGAYCRPHLRVYYVDAPASHEGELDPELSERLRALGYAE